MRDRRENDVRKWRGNEIVESTLQREKENLRAKWKCERYETVDQMEKKLREK